MARYTPETYHVYNEIDKQGLLLGLPRLTDERNASYKQRIMDVYVNRADSTYRGLINGITRELGFSLTDSIRIVAKTDTDGDTLLTMPAVVFQDTKCYLYSDYSQRTLLETIDRFELGATYDILGLYNAIVDTGYWDVTLLSDANTGDRAMTLFNQSSANLVPSESLVGRGSITQLENRNLIEDTVSIVSSNLTSRVDTQVDLINNTDYYIDYPNGVIYSVETPNSGSYIRYEYCSYDFTVKASPVIIHNLQSDDFKTKMYEQVLTDDDSYVNGQPTNLGADIINELLSIYPTAWGE